jgi:hypothetical protein
VPTRPALTLTPLDGIGVKILLVRVAQDVPIRSVILNIKDLKGIVLKGIVLKEITS